MSAQSAQLTADRQCPMCGVMTADKHCPEHGVETVAITEFARDALSYRAGDTISGRYRITGTLGKGGFGAVYAAEHVSTLQEIAVKILSLDPANSDDDVVRRFFKEAQITARLSHPNTVRVFDVGQADDGPLFLAMEMLRGPTLDQVLKQLGKEGKAMTDRQALDVAIPVLRSMTEAHEAGLVHRDLKPANIMMAQLGGDEPVVKVLDFGCARTEDSSLTAAGTALGTPAYMSPEQCMGKALDGRSDLYSLGVIMYWCAVGQLPFVDKNPLSLMYMHTHLAPPDPATAGKRRPHPLVCEALRKALAKDRNDRYADAKAMREELERIRGELDVPISGSLSIVVDDDSSDDTGLPTQAVNTMPYAAGTGDAPDDGTQVLQTDGWQDEGSGDDSLTALVSHVSAAMPKVAPPSEELRKATGSSSQRTRSAGPSPSATVALDASGVDAAALAAKKPPVALIGGIGLVVIGVGVALVFSGDEKATPPPAAAPTAVVSAKPETSKADQAKAKMLADMAAAEADLGRRIEYLKDAVRLAPDDPGYAELLDRLRKQQQEVEAAKAARAVKAQEAEAALAAAEAEKARAQKAAEQAAEAERRAAAAARAARAARKPAPSPPKPTAKAAVRPRFMDDEAPAKKKKSEVKARFMD